MWTPRYDEMALALTTDARLDDKARRAKGQIRVIGSSEPGPSMAIPMIEPRLPRLPSPTQELTGCTPKQAAVDKGFRGQKHHPPGLQVLVTGARKFKGVLKRLLKRRSAIEPVIGHAKQDHSLKRNYLQGTHGDRLNALLVACGFNLRKLCRYFRDSPTSEAPVSA